MMSFSANPLASVMGGSLASSKACTPAVNNLYSFASQVSMDCPSALRMLQCFTRNHASCGAPAGHAITAYVQACP